MKKFYIFVRCWRGFPASFLFDKFNGLPDAEIEVQSKQWREGGKSDRSFARRVVLLSVSDDVAGRRISHTLGIQYAGHPANAKFGYFAEQSVEQQLVYDMNAEDLRRADGSILGDIARYALRLLERLKVPDKQVPSDDSTGRPAKPMNRAANPTDTLAIPPSEPHGYRFVFPEPPATYWVIDYPTDTRADVCASLRKIQGKLREVGESYVRLLHPCSQIQINEELYKLGITVVPMPDGTRLFPEQVCAHRQQRAAESVLARAEAQGFLQSGDNWREHLILRHYERDGTPKHFQFHPPREDITANMFFDALYHWAQISCAQVQTEGPPGDQYGQWIWALEVCARKVMAPKNDKLGDDIDHIRRQILSTDVQPNAKLIGAAARSLRDLVEEIKHERVNEADAEPIAMRLLAGAIAAGAFSHSRWMLCRQKLADDPRIATFLQWVFDHPMETLGTQAAEHFATARSCEDGGNLLADWLDKEAMKILEADQQGVGGALSSSSPKEAQELAGALTRFMHWSVEFWKEMGKARDLLQVNCQPSEWEWPWNLPAKCEEWRRAGWLEGNIQGQVRTGWARLLAALHETYLEVSNALKSVETALGSVAHLTDDPNVPALQRWTSTLRNEINRFTSQLAVLSGLIAEQPTRGFLNALLQVTAVPNHPDMHGLKKAMEKRIADLQSLPAVLNGPVGGNEKTSEDEGAQRSPSEEFAFALYEFRHVTADMFGKKQKYVESQGLADGHEVTGLKEGANFWYGLVLDSWPNVQANHKALVKSAFTPAHAIDEVDPREWRRRVLSEVDEVVYLLGGECIQRAKVEMSTKDELRLRELLLGLQRRESEARHAAQDTRPVESVEKPESDEGKETANINGNTEDGIEVSRTSADPHAGWLTVTEAAKRLMKGSPKLKLGSAKAMVSTEASRHKPPFQTNGKYRTERRIDRDSFASWVLDKRDRDLDAEDDD